MALPTCALTYTCADWMAESPRINRRGRTKPSDRQHNFFPEVDLESILELRSNAEVYEKFYKYMVPSIGRKTFWKDIVTSVKADQDVTTVSNEAFALLVLENNWERWIDLFNNSRCQNPPVKGRKRISLSDKKPKYTRGGILYSSNSNRDDGKGWSNEGIERFNELFDLVRKDRKKHPGFIARFLEAQKASLEKKIQKAKRKLIDVPVARHELFSDSEEEVEPPQKRMKPVESDEESVASD